LVEEFETMHQQSKQELKKTINSLDFENREIPANFNLTE